LSGRGRLSGRSRLCSCRRRRRLRGSGCSDSSGGGACSSGRITGGVPRVGRISYGRIETVYVIHRQHISIVLGHNSLWFVRRVTIICIWSVTRMNAIARR